jgi:hypothetical protein
MNITLALEDELVARAREVAKRQGTTLNDLVRRHLESIAGRTTGAAIAEELRRLWAEHPGHSGGRRISRDEAYEGRI